MLSEVGMRKLMLVLFAAWATALPPAGAADFHEVVVHDYRFDPPSLAVAVGDTVTWSRSATAADFHNVAEDRGLFTSGPPSATPGWTYGAIFSAGRFRYICEQHVDTAGMKGVVRVPPTVDPGPSGRPFTVRWSVSDASTGETFDVQYRAGGGRWRGWLSDTAARKRVFGKGERPEAAEAGSYAFRARSRRDDAVGRWSPVVTFRP